MQRSSRGGRYNQFRLSDPQFLLAMALQKGIKSGPAQGGWTEGIARLGQALIAKKARDEATDSFEAREIDRGAHYDKVARSMSPEWRNPGAVPGYTPPAAALPQGATDISTNTGQMLPTGGGGVGAIAQSMMGGPDEELRAQGIGLMAGNVKADRALADYERKMKIKKRLGVTDDKTPMSELEYKFYKSLPIDERKEYMRVKRADKIMNLGGSIVVPDLTDPTKAAATYQKTLKPGERPPALAEASEAKASGGKIGTENAEQFYAVKHAINQREDIAKLVNHLETSDAITGFGADILKNIERAKARFGARAKTASDTEILDVMMGKEVFPMIKALGVGARGMDTPAEREFMRSVLTGSISLNKATLIEMAKIRAAVAERTIANWNKRMDGGELDRFYENQGIPKKPIGLTTSAGDGWSIKKVY